MHIVVNGQPRTVADSTTVRELIALLGLEKAACAVEVNLKLVPKPQHPDHALREGDQIEVVTLVGGG